MSKLSKSTGASSLDVATAAAAAGGGCDTGVSFFRGAAARGDGLGDAAATGGDGASGGGGGSATRGGSGRGRAGSGGAATGSSTSSTTWVDSGERCLGVGSTGTSIERPPATTPTASDQRRAIVPTDSRSMSNPPIPIETSDAARSPATRGRPEPRSALRGSSDHTPMGPTGSRTCRLPSRAAGRDARGADEVGRGLFTNGSVLRSMRLTGGISRPRHGTVEASVSGLAVADSPRDVAKATLEIPASRRSSSTDITRR